MYSIVFEELLLTPSDPGEGGSKAGIKSLISLIDQDAQPPKQIKAV